MESQLENEMEAGFIIGISSPIFGFRVWVDGLRVRDLSCCGQRLSDFGRGWA